MTDNRESAERWGTAAWWGALTGLVVLAGVTRIFRLTAWGLAGDELFTWFDSLNFRPTLFGRPLLYALNHYLVRPLLSLDAFGLRFLPATFGIVSVPVIALVARRLVSDRAALLAALLVVFSAWHLNLSQQARYYTLVYLIASVTPAALWIGLRDRSKGWIGAGLVLGGVGFFAHPTTILPIGGFLLWWFGHGVLRTDGRRRRVAIIGSVALGVAGLLLGVQLLRQWTALGQEWGIGGASLLISYVTRLGTGPAAASVGGVILLWLSGRRSLATFLVAVVLGPVALLAVLGRVVSVRTAYLFATAPYALLGAGVFLDRVMARFEASVERYLVGAVLTGTVIATVLPWYVSHYLDGGNPDVRGAAAYVAERYEPEDAVVAEQPLTVRYYEPQLGAVALHRNPSRLDSIWRRAGARTPPGDLWILPVVRSQGGFGLRRLGEAEGWVRERCRKQERFGSVRIDHRRSWVPVWRCPPSDSVGG